MGGGGGGGCGAMVSGRSVWGLGGQGAVRVWGGGLGIGGQWWVDNTC